MMLVFACAIRADRWTDTDTGAEIEYGGRVVIREGSWEDENKIREDIKEGAREWFPKKLGWRNHFVSQFQILTREYLLEYADKAR